MPRVFLRGNVDCTLQLVHDAAHHVHTHAAPGNFRNLGCRAESRFENKIECFLVGQACGFFGFDDSLLDGLLAHMHRIDTPAIIPHFDNDLRSLMICVEIHRPRAGFPAVSRSSAGSIP